MRSPLRMLVASATLATTLIPLRASAADTAMKGDAMSETPCAQAAIAMSGSHGNAMHGDAMKGDAMKSGGEAGVDAAFVAAMNAKTKELMELAKLEMRCGSDAKAKSAAERSLIDLQQIRSTLTIF